MEIKNKVLSYIKKHNLISYGDSIICAVSGGADSVCMLNILLGIKEEFNLKLFVAHLNHGLRGDEALRDEHFVEVLCKKHSLPFYKKYVDINALSKELKVSCEEAGRIARYDFFDELKISLGAVKVSTAHNKNDNVETVLMRILRGTDLRGLSGISCFNDNNVIRPILCLSRTEIEEYLKCKGLDFVTDSTNSENDFTRNKIRNDLIPKLTNEYNQSFTDVFSSNIELYKEANSFIDEYVNNEFSRVIKKEPYSFQSDVNLLLTINPYIVKRIIKKAVFELSDLNISNSLCDIIFNSLKNKTPVSVNKNVDFYVKYETAYFIYKNSNSQDFFYNISGFGKYYIPEISSYIEVSEGNKNISYNDKNTIYLDAERINPNFVLRNRQNGDKMHLSNCGTKKLKDILIDEKIPSFLRDKIPVLLYDNKIIWLCGVRDDITLRKRNGNKYIKITIHKENDNA